MLSILTWTKVVGMTLQCVHYSTICNMKRSFNISIPTIYTWTNQTESCECRVAFKDMRQAPRCIHQEFYSDTKRRTGWISLNKTHLPIWPLIALKADTVLTLSRRLYSKTLGLGVILTLAVPRKKSALPENFSLKPAFSLQGRLSFQTWESNSQMQRGAERERKTHNYCVHV